MLRHTGHRGRFLAASSEYIAYLCTICKPPRTHPILQVLRSRRPGVSPMTRVPNQGQHRELGKAGAAQSRTRDEHREDARGLVMPCACVRACV